MQIFGRSAVLFPFFFTILVLITVLILLIVSISVDIFESEDSLSLFPNRKTLFVTVLEPEDALRHGRTSGRSGLAVVNLVAIMADLVW
ncbi:hypothetical protein E2542_SST31158 [Spatholobus suberectus]|nr:hypothetical protein E2542_SST31158 [Spatholobus suberectus]